jgi:predicted transcriptional regulator
MMAPYKHANTVDWHRRSNYRANFCRSIVSRAEEIANTLIHNQNWRHAFYVGKDSKAFLQLPLSSAFDSLQRKAHELTQTLESFPHENGEPLLVMVFDEARSLLKSDISGEPDFGRYHALNRIISYLKEFPMWFFFPSTDSQVGMLISADDMEVRRVCDRSARIAFTGGYPFRCFPPFVGLRVDVEDRKRMRDPDSRTKELHKKMNDFTQPKHMAMFGRPLWFGYNPAKMNQLAKAKLVGGGEWARYNAGDVHHVFAALSFRLSLDFNLQNPKAHSLARIAVRSFMRVVISMDQETGVLDTITPSEPVVAEAAMEHLCKNRNWSESIETLTEKLLDKGLIDKGLKGELYSRFVLILARDWLQKNASPTSVPKLQATFTVQQFLMALYNDHESVLLIPRKIREAWMNFNHFVSTKEHLTPKVIPGLLHDLLRRRAAIQLARNQPTYDKLIPIYFGNPDEPFDVSCCGVILVLDRNNDRVTTPRNIFETTFTAVNPEHESQPIPKAANSIRNGSYFLLNEMTNPVLFLLFDLGVTQHTYAPSAPVQVSHTSGRTPVVWAIHSHGHDREVFGCLGHMRCNDASGWFFTSLETEKNEHNELCRRNDIFSELERNFRYSGFDEVHVAKRKWDGEEDIESRDKDGDTQVEDV